MRLDDFLDTLTVSKYVKITKVSTDSSVRYIQELLGKGIIIKEGSSRVFPISWLLLKLTKQRKSKRKSWQIAR